MSCPAVHKVSPRIEKWPDDVIRAFYREELIHAICQTYCIKKDALFHLRQFRLRSPAPFVEDLSLPLPKQEEPDQDSVLLFGQYDWDVISMTHWGKVQDVHSHKDIFEVLFTILDFVETESLLIDCQTHFFHWPSPGRLAVFSLLRKLWMIQVESR
jgi:hypothetical protein